jgi:hypothetical protein
MHTAIRPPPYCCYRHKMAIIKAHLVRSCELMRFELGQM